MNNTSKFKQYIESKQSAVGEQQEGLNALNSAETTEVQSLEQKIGDLIRQRDELQSQIDALNAKIEEVKNRNKVSREYYSSLVDFAQQDLLNTVDLVNKTFGGYDVYSLGTVLANLTSRMLGVECVFVKEYSNYIRAGFVDSDVYYIREEAKIKCAKTGENLCTFAMSGIPSTGDFWHNGTLYLGKLPKDRVVTTRLYKFIDVQLASIDLDTGDFMCKLPEASENVNCDFIRDFITYVSNVRLERGYDRFSEVYDRHNIEVGKITGEELQTLADTFFAEHRADYSFVSEVQPTSDKSHTIKPISDVIRKISSRFGRTDN